MRLARKPQLFVHDPGGRYLPLINQLHMECQVHASVKLDQLLSAVVSTVGAIGLVSIDPHLDSRRLTGLLSPIHRAARQSTTAILFAVGPPAIRTMQRELLIAGFALVVGSTAEFGRIRTSATRHWNRIRWPQQTIEVAIACNLPWQPTGKHGFQLTPTDNRQRS